MQFELLRRKRDFGIVGNARPVDSPIPKPLTAYEQRLSVSDVEKVSGTIIVAFLDLNYVCRRDPHDFCHSAFKIAPRLLMMGFGLLNKLDR